MRKLDFKTLFEESTRPALVISANPPTFSILAVSAGFSELIGKQQGAVLGAGFREVLRSNADIDDNTRELLCLSLERVADGAHAETRVVSEGHRSWSVFCGRVSEAHGRMQCIVQWWDDVTEVVALRRHTTKQTTERRTLVARLAQNATIEAFVARHLQGMDRTLDVGIKERDNLAAIFRHAPVPFAIVRAADFVCEEANPAFRRLVGERPIVGHALFVAFPGEEGALESLLCEAAGSGQARIAHELRSVLQGGESEQKLWSVLCAPLLEEEGHSARVIVVCSDVTA